MTREQVIQETKNHISAVAKNIDIIIECLIERRTSHDKTKLEDPELETFVKYTPKLERTEYGSPLYESYLIEMKPALKHHYENNRHHPEHYVAGISGMTLIDLIEMYCDWAAAVKRHATGNLRKSILINRKRFNISMQLTEIFLNTIETVTCSDGTGNKK